MQVVSAIDTPQHRLHRHLFYSDFSRFAGGLVAAQVFRSLRRAEQTEVAVVLVNQFRQSKALCLCLRCANGQSLIRGLFEIFRAGRR